MKKLFSMMIIGIMLASSSTSVFAQNELNPSGDSQKYDERFENEVQYLNAPDYYSDEY